VGYDPAYGARPLKRVIQKQIETPLARLLLEGRLVDGQMVSIDREIDSDGLSFEPASVAEETL
jgi:ATP-dependent Clp protease ATP-binding subunit ClpB